MRRLLLHEWCPFDPYMRRGRCHPDLRLQPPGYVNTMRNPRKPLTLEPDPESKMGQYLLCRSEFHARVEYRSSVTVARRTRAGDPDIPQAKIICGASNGALYSLTPIDEAAGKRLQLLQGQLTRNVQHVAALNPKTQRCVPYR